MQRFALSLSLPRLCMAQHSMCRAALVSQCLPPNSCLDSLLSCLSPAEHAVLSPDPGVTKQSPYPLLWEHEVKGTAAYDRHLLTSRPLSLLIHMNHHHRLHVADKDTIRLKYIIHRIHPPGGGGGWLPLHKVLCNPQHSAHAKHLTSCQIASVWVLKTILFERWQFGHKGEKWIFIRRIKAS